MSNLEVNNNVDNDWLAKFIVHCCCCFFFHGCFGLIFLVGWFFFLVGGLSTATEVFLFCFFFCFSRFAFCQTKWLLLVVVDVGEPSYKRFVSLFLSSISYLAFPSLAAKIRSFFSIKIQRTAGPWLSRKVETRLVG